MLSDLLCRALYSTVFLCYREQNLPKIIIDDTIYLFLKTAISILVISNHNSFRVSFDKIASVACILFEKCIYILALEMVSTGNQHFADCIGTLSFATAVL